ncbi:MAG: hypothetical protein IK128_03185 [Clostridiales bacterium]|nr:hypothetical protein [Clostridiales bacterium]
MKKTIHMRRSILVLIVMMLVASVVCSCIRPPVIGEVYGSEHQYIVIDGETYTECNNPGVNKNTDRNEKLGIVVFRSNEDEYMTVWSLKGYENNEYIYTLWVYDGAYYKKDTNQNEDG